MAAFYRLSFLGFLCFALVMALCPQTAQSQQARLYENIYRPSAELMELNSPRFRIIFPAGEDVAAFRAARILEDQYPMVQALVGGELRQFPVVLNAHNDRGNGFVTTLHFRSEIELPPLKGNALNPRTGGWMENVAPHELVHALHFSHIPPYSIAGFTGIFAPDAARSFHGAAPLGMIEGIAVFHESNVVYRRGGRGNYALFRNQSWANLSGAPAAQWSLAQHLMPAAYSFPGNRHYTGGHEFISWLQYRYGMETTRESIDFFVKYPFLGYGMALRRATGYGPASLYEQYRQDSEALIEQEAPVAETSGAAESHTQLVPLPPGADAAEHYAPAWLDADHVVYAQHTQYNQRPGFYVSRVDEAGQPAAGELLYETTQIGDFIYELSPGDSTLLYGRYHRHPYHANTARAELHELNLETKTTRRITPGGRINAPARRADGAILGLRALHESLQPVLVQADGSVKALPDAYPDSFVQIAPSPVDPDYYAVIANRNGVQALWLIESDTADFSEITRRNPDVGFREGLVHDVHWHPGGRHLLLSATRDNAPQVYEYHPESQRLAQLTAHRFGAWQASYRPAEHDAAAGEELPNDISFVTQHENSRRIGLLPRRHMLERRFFPVDFQPELQRDEDAPPEENRLSSYRTSEIESLPVTPYRSRISWLLPRVVSPFAEQGGLVQDNRFGLLFQGGDVLQRHSWEAGVSYANERLWGEGSYRYSGFYPGLITEGFYRPRESSIGLLAERGAALRIPLSWRLDHRSRSTFWQLEPGISLRELRPELVLDGGQLREAGSGEFDWLTDLSLDARLAFYHRLQQNRRDIQPNSGRVFFVRAEQFIYSDREARVSGLRTGISQYLSPSLKRNHGLRLDAELLTQSRTRLFGTSGLVYQGFSENVLSGARNAVSLRARYVLPLRYIDDGYISVPVFVDRLYMSLNANYVADINTLDAPFSAADALDKGQAVYGVELRANLRFFNLPLDVGLGLGYQPARGDITVFGDAR